MQKMLFFVLNLFKSIFHTNEIRLTIIFVRIHLCQQNMINREISPLPLNG